MHALLCMLQLQPNSEVTLFFLAHADNFTSASQFKSTLLNPCWQNIFRTKYKLEISREQSAGRITNQL